MKKALRFICIVLVVALALPGSAFAALPESDVSTNSLFFVSRDSWLDPISNSRFYVCYDITAKDIMQELGVVEILVQRSANGTSGWTTMATYTSDDRPEFICTNTSSHGGYFVYLATAGYYYRARMYYYAKNSTGIGKSYDYTPVIYLQPHT